MRAGTLPVNGVVHEDREADRETVHSRAPTVDGSWNGSTPAAWAGVGSSWRGDGQPARRAVLTTIVLAYLSWIPCLVGLEAIE